MRRMETNIYLKRQRCDGGDRDASEETKMRLKKWEGGILSGDVAVYRFAYALISTGFSVLFPVHILCFSGFGSVVPWREMVGRGHSVAWLLSVAWQFYFVGIS